MEFLNLRNKKNLIEGVILYKLNVHRDPRGILVETIRNDWLDVLNINLPFAQSYYSITPSGTARDEELWHVHPTKQVDRFVVIKGNAVFAVYDWRDNSKTKNVLNLFMMGEGNGDNDQFLLIIPKNVLHGFCAIGESPCYLINYPTALYDKSEEGRVSHNEVNIRLDDSSPFSWKTIRDYFKKS
ncbi:MAG: dTDP-4-dehydrorhamnose 3,5-epimerase family protein [Candidatus Gottesmanbacteria bacterium]